MFYEIDEDGFIVEFGIGDKGTAISADRYVAIRESFRVCPGETDDYYYRLSTDVEWVAVPKDNTPKENEQ